MTPDPFFGWVRFVLCLSAILLCAFVVLPRLQRVSAVREVREAIRRADIDATALFYTESRSSGEAEAAVRNRIRFPLARHRQSGD
jgi:hypothetical protein